MYGDKLQLAWMRSLGLLLVGFVFHGAINLVWGDAVAGFDSILIKVDLSFVPFLSSCSFDSWKFRLVHGFGAEKRTTEQI
jgi:hypothetical protein